jgi:hypothetical protein
MNYIIKNTTEQLENIGGLILAGEVFKRIGLNMASTDEVKHPEVLRAMLGLLVQGRTSYEEIEIYRHSNLYRTALGLNFVPAKETLRLYLKEISKSETIKPILDTINLNMLEKCSLTPVASSKCSYIPVDIDVSPMDNSRTHKENVSWTYKGHDGFAPIFAYIGAEGYMLDSELRPGKQHCQKNTPEFLQKVIGNVDGLQSETPFLFRLDGGNDSFDTIKVLNNSGHFFLIKRNLRKDSKDGWLDTAMSLVSPVIPRKGKHVYTGIVTKTHPKCDEMDLDIVFKVTKRTIDAHGNGLLFPEIEVETYWTNLYEDAKDVINLYHDHGTSEQFHSELKTDMDVERLPSRNFEVNKLVLQLAMIAFNTLRFIGQTALQNRSLLPTETKVKRKRLRKVISDLIYIACKYVHRSRQHFVHIWEKNPWGAVFREVYKACRTI